MRWLLLVLGLEIPRQSHAVNLGGLLLVLGLGLTEASCCSLERIYEVVKHEPRPAIDLEKQLRWALKLGGAESLGISKVGQTVLAKLMGVSDMTPACQLGGGRV